MKEGDNIINLQELNIKQLQTLKKVIDIRIKVLRTEGRY